MDFTINNMIFIPVKGSCDYESTEIIPLEFENYKEGLFRAGASIEKKYVI